MFLIVKEKVEVEGEKKKLSTFVDLISDNERLAFENAMREKKETGAKGGNTEEERGGNLNSNFLKQRSRFPTPPPRRLPPLSTSTTRRRSAGPRGRSPRGPRSWRMPLSLLEFFFFEREGKVCELSSLLFPLLVPLDFSLPSFFRSLSLFLPLSLITHHGASPARSGSSSAVGTAGPRGACAARTGSR